MFVTPEFRWARREVLLILQEAGILWLSRKEKRKVGRKRSAL
jgi:zona occludens toxin (predicted ATPase)